MFHFKNSKQFLSKDETEKILEVIRMNETYTSGEIRICIEGHCEYMDPMEKARELFFDLKMYNTQDRNAVLIYIAHKDKDFALFADGAIYKKVEPDFWKKESKKLVYHFYHHQYLLGITTCISNVGDQLKKYFPWEGEKKNELPDEIVFGR